MPEQDHSAPDKAEIEPSNSVVESPETEAISLDQFIESENVPVLSPSPSLAFSIDERAGVVSVRPLSVEQQRERTRTGLAVSLLTLLTISVLGISAYIVVDVLNPRELSQERRNMHRELMTILWTSQVTLAGSALGFYFGSQKDQSK